MSDIECPYCGHEQEVCHDDGFGCEEDTYHQDECSSCEKEFVFTTAISFSYCPKKADCLNGSDHNYKPTFTYPVSCTRMQCDDCGEERQPTETELNDVIRAREAKEI